MDRDFLEDLSIGWQRIYEGLPSYNIVQITEGFDLIFYCIYEAARRRRKVQLDTVHSSLEKNILKLDQHISTERIEKLSHKIVLDDLEALCAVLESIQRKLAEGNPHFNPSSLMTTDALAFAEKYVKTRNPETLKALTEAVADMILTNDVDKAENFKAAIGYVRMRTDKYVGPLFGRETVLSHFLLASQRFSVR